jgi:membrane protein
MSLESTMPGGSAGGIFGDLRSLAGRVSSFFGTRVWSVQLADLQKGKASLYRAGRIAYSTFQGLKENGVTFRAAALTYFSVLSIVPFLAFAFSVLKGFGAYRRFLEQVVRPYLAENFGANPTLLQGIETVLNFVDKTDVSSLSAVAMLFFVYTSISLLSNVESVLNDTWGAKHKRSLLRQVTDYTTLLITTPLLMLVAVTFATAAQSSGVVLFLRNTLALGPVIDFFLRLTSLVVACLAFVALYMILPNVRTRLSSAVLGGIVGGLLWQISLIVHVQFQMGVARYNAVYSGFGAIPIFLVWIYVSWLTVLFGAQLAASHQNEPTVRQLFRARHADQAFKERLAMVIAAQVTRDYLEGCPRLGQETIAERLEVPLPTVVEVLDDLVRANIVARTVEGTTYTHLPARDIDQIRIEDVRKALRHDPRADDLCEAIGRQLGAEMQRYFRQLAEHEQRSPYNLTLRQTAALLPGDRAPREERTTEQAGDKAIVDGKQPDVPT